MNEPIIHDSTPKGSVILAYGEISSPNKLRALAFILPGLGLLFILTMVLRTLFSSTVPVPNNTFVLAYISPSKELPQPYTDYELFAVMKNEARWLPIFIGFYNDTTGKRRPFVIAPRTFTSTFWKTETSGIWQLIGTEENVPHELRTLRSVVSSWEEYFAQAWLRIWPGRLLPDNGSEFDTDQSIGGVIDSGRWNTDLPAPSDVPERDSVQGQNFLDTRALPETWKLLEPTFRVYDLDIQLATLPSRARWSLDETSRLSLALDFDQGLDLETKAILAGAAGVVDQVTYTLPDGTVVTENRRPTDSLRQATTTTWTLADGRRVILEEKTVLLGDPELLSRQTNLPENCKGRILAVFDRFGSQNLLSNLGFSDFLSFEAFVLLEEDGKIVACW